MERNTDLMKIKAWLSSGDSYQRAIALAIVSNAANIRDEEIDQKIVRLLRTDDQYPIRRDAIRFLAKQNDQKFAAVFIEVLDDSDWLVRGEAILGLETICPDFQKIPRVIQFFEEETHPYGRWCAGIM